MKALKTFIVKETYMASDTNYILISKATGFFVGLVGINTEGDDGEEGEMSISLIEEVDKDELMTILGGLHKVVGHKKVKRIAVQYSFD